MKMLICVWFRDEFYYLGSILNLVNDWKMCFQVVNPPPNKLEKLLYSQNDMNISHCFIWNDFEFLQTILWTVVVTWPGLSWTLNTWRKWQNMDIQDVLMEHCSLTWIQPPTKISANEVGNPVTVFVTMEGNWKLFYFSHFVNNKFKIS